MGEGEYDGWADLGAQRRAEDEALVQRYAAGEGRGQDMRPVRGFVQHVRRDIGPRGLILDVRMIEKGRGHEVWVWYRLPGDEASRPQTMSVTDDRPAGDEAAGPAAGALAAMARASAPLPPAPAARPADPATGASPATAARTGRSAAGGAAPAGSTGWIGAGP